MTGAPARRRPHGGGRTTALAVLLVTLAGCTSGSESPSAASSPRASGEAAAVVETVDIPRVVRNVEASIVTLFTGHGLGSGVVFNSDGTIVTDEHVVRGATTLDVSFADGRRATARVVATDPLTDIAVVRADRTGLPAAQFRSDLPAVGEPAIAIGSPLGLEQTVTSGIISGQHRVIPAGDGRSAPLVDLLQTDAAISPGNSGGALLDATGRVIGLNEAYIPPSAGAVSIGFATPTATVLDIVGQLLATGMAHHAYAGLQPAALTPEVAEQLGVRLSAGIVVLDVAKGGPADQAGIRPGDVLVALDGKPIARVEDFLAALRAHRPGDRVRVTIVRGTARSDVTLTVGDRPAVTAR
jgi:serine protease DegQ